MPRRNKKPWTNKLYVMVDNLHKVIRRGYKDDKEQCQVMVNYYVKRGYLNGEMKKIAKSIINRNWSLIKPKPLSGSHYLYAISDGYHIKIGMSKNYQNRLKIIQIGCARQLELVWSCYAAECSREALKQEKKLHRALKQYHVRGEWFSLDCMSIVDGWEVKNRESKAQEMAEEVNSSLDEEFRLILGPPGC